MALRAKVTVDTTGIVLFGTGIFKDDLTFLQDAGRSAVLASFTVVSQQASDQKLIPLTDVNPALTSASLECGANGGNLAAWQAVGDGSFTIVVDGTSLDVTGLVFTAVGALTDIASIINIALAGRALCVYDQVGDVFWFFSLKKGLPESTITVLTAGSAGTDISGAGFLNGLTTVGTVTAATGEISASIPAGIFWGEDIAAASLVAGDVTNQKLLVGGSNYILDEAKIVLENSLTLDDVIVPTSKTIRQHLEDLGIYTRDTYVNGQIAPI